MTRSATGSRGWLERALAEIQALDPTHTYVLRTIALTREPDGRRQFTCEGCGGTFWTTTPIPKRDAECRGLYGGKMPAESDLASACDACYANTLAALADRVGVE